MLHVLLTVTSYKRGENTDFMAHQVLFSFQILVCPGVLSVTTIGTQRGVTNGGPLGDLLQWAHLIGALLASGHDVIGMAEVPVADRT